MPSTERRCPDCVFIANLACGLVADHAGPHVGVAPDEPRIYRWTRTPSWLNPNGPGRLRLTRGPLHKRQKVTS